MSLSQVVSREKLLHFLEGCNDGFQNFIFPQIQAESYNPNRMNLSNLYLGVISYGSSIGLYRSGLNCLTRARLIEEELRANRIPEKKLVSEFGAYLAQVKMAVQVSDKS